MVHPTCGIAGHCADAGRIQGAGGGAVSTTGSRLPLAEAIRTAELFQARIRGESHIVGSVRRHCETVGDIEIMLHRDATLALEVSDSPLFPADWTTVRGGKTGWKYWQIEHRSGLHVDLYRFDADNRGSIMLIRTGPAEFSRRWVMALEAQGYRHKDGYLHRRSGLEHLSCLQERDAFAAAGWPYVEPSERR